MTPDELSLDTVFAAAQAGSPKVRRNSLAELRRRLQVAVEARHNEAEDRRREVADLKRQIEVLHETRNWLLDALKEMLRK